MNPEPSKPPRQIIHLDMDCFYVSVERLHNPALESLPVAVGGASEQRGVISSASYEARVFGVRSAMPTAEAKRLCPQLVVVPHTPGRYSKYSRQIEQVLLEFTPLVQMASQDEAYLDVTGTERLFGPVLKLAQQLRERVLAQTKLPCSLGIGTNKLVAKIASGLCKPKGLLFIPDGSEERFLANLPVRKLPGVGKKAAERLTSLGVRRVEELAGMEPRLLEAHFGQWGLEMAERARGISTSPVIVDQPPKSIGAEETFARDSVDLEFLDGVLAGLCEKTAGRLRGNGCHGQTITLKFRYADFETHTAAVTLPAPTHDELVLLQAGRELLTKKWKRQRALRLIGITVSQLYFGDLQMDMLESERRTKQDEILKAVDAIRGKYGFGGIRRGSSE